jgi:hypothetical protein
MNYHVNHRKSWNDIRSTDFTDFLQMKGNTATTSKEEGWSSKRMNRTTLSLLTKPLFVTNNMY